MKTFLNAREDVTDATGKVLDNMVDIAGATFNKLRLEFKGHTFGNYEMMLILSKGLDLYRNLDILTVLVDCGVITKVRRGRYAFTSEPVYKNIVYKAFVALRAKHLCK